jgi:hypothetical protein
MENTENSVILTVRDKLKADRPVTVSYLNHTLSPPVMLSAGCVNVSRGDCMMSIEPVSGLLATPNITDKFSVGVNDGVPPEYQVDAPPQYHLRWESKAAAEHDIIVKYIIVDI